MKKRFILFFTSIMVALTTLTAIDQNTNKAGAITLAHPRLLLLKGEEKGLLNQISGDKYWQKVHQTIIDESDKLIFLPENERIKDGRRLLAVSRENLKRIFYLSYAYRMTNDQKYAKRAEAEMLKTASFIDWNPSHFLDVAEMTMAMAIGYDWLYNYLSPASRDIIKRAIIDKGITPSLEDKNNYWLKSTNNWNQVCNAGITFGALTVYEDIPQLAQEMINRAVESIKIPMTAYGSDGAYPEGITYWNYGTSFNAMLISSLEKVYKTDFGLCSISGFLNTGLYSQQMMSPMLNQFNYGDNKTQSTFSPVVFWFYAKTQNPALLYLQGRIINKGILNRETERLLPAAVLWGVGSKASLNNLVEPKDLTYKGVGESSVTVFRSSWSDPNGIYLGFKLGSASVNHAHLDVGSFYLDADSVQWGIDLGQENYTSLEAKGVLLWDKQRWDVFRYNNLSHNLLIINNRLQNPTAKAEINKYNENPDLMLTTSDLSTIYEGQVKSMKRGVALINKKYVLVEDVIETLPQFSKARWNMATMADEMIPISENTVLLKKGNKKLYMVVQSNVKINFKTWSTTSENSYDSPNPDSRFVGFETELPLEEKVNIKVFLIPGELNTDLFKGSLF
jgi:Domain of unknown function (DUF4962)/Heparinase II/III-like protein